MPSGGIEYVVEAAQPPNLFIVVKRLRRGLDSAGAQLLAVYYVLDRCVYQVAGRHGV